MAKVSWMQVVLSIADAYRAASGTSGKIAVGDLPGLIRQGVGVLIDTTVTAGLNPFKVNAKNGEPFKSVTVNPTPSKAITVTAGAADKRFFHDDESLISEVKVQPTPTMSKVVTPAKDAFVVTPENGYHLSSVAVSGDANLVPECIARDKSIFGVVGTFMGGIAPEDMGCTKLAIDKFTPSEDLDSNNYAIPHTLGETPKMAILTMDHNASLLYEESSTSYDTRCYSVMAYTITGPKNFVSESGGAGSYNFFYTRSKKTEIIDTHYASATMSQKTLTGSAVTLRQTRPSYGDKIYYCKGVEYTLITLA